MERVTGADGTFSARVSPGASPPLERREVVVYKPGYRPWIERTRDTEATLFGQTVVGLTKVAILDEARRYRDARDVGVELCASPVEVECVRPDQVPHLIRLLQIHRKVIEPPAAGFVQPGEEGR